MPSRSLRLTLLFMAIVMPLAGCIVVPYRHRDYGDRYDRRGPPVYAPSPYAPSPGYYRGY